MTLPCSESLSRRSASAPRKRAVAMSVLAAIATTLLLAFVAATPAAAVTSDSSGLSLSPVTDVNAVGSQHTVTARLTHNGQPVANETVRFEVSGANSTAGEDVTDAEGRAFFAYTGANAGADLIVACHDANDNNDCEGDEETAAAAKLWIVGAGGTTGEALVLVPVTDANQTGAEHTVTATLTANGQPAANATLRFQVSGANTATGEATTNAQGQATFTYTGANAGVDVIVACHDADNDNSCDPGEASATATKRFEVTAGGQAPTQPAGPAGPQGSAPAAAPGAQAPLGAPTRSQRKRSRVGARLIVDRRGRDVILRVRGRGIRRVQFFRGRQRVGTRRGAPFQVRVRGLRPGVHRFRARVFFSPGAARPRTLRGTARIPGSTALRPPFTG